MAKYEWRDDQLWELERGCWVIWRTVSGQIGITDELRGEIARLLNAESDWQPHEDPERTAYVESLETEYKRLVTERDESQAQNAHMTNKLARIITHIPLIGGLSHDAVREIADIILMQLPPSNPIAVEASHAEMLAEIDKVLVESGVWVGGRLDSIKQLIEMTRPSWGAGDEYVASLREQWGQINELVANSIGRTPEKSLVDGVRRLVEDYERTRVNWSRAEVYLRDMTDPSWFKNQKTVREMARKALGLEPPDTSGGEYDPNEIQETGELLGDGSVDPAVRGKHE